MKNSIYCPMIHGGLNINIKNASSNLTYNQCCLSTNYLTWSDDSLVKWDNTNLQNIREKNSRNEWDSGCWQCERLEKTGANSFRQSMIEKFGVKEGLSGPQRIDLLFDRNCNLACRTCSPNSSTFWQKHLKENNLKFGNISDDSQNLETILRTLKSLDLSNLRTVQFCGGETLLGNSYWKAAEAIAELVPDSKHNIELGFQTNGTQPIHTKHYETIEKFKLVKLLISIDGINDRFEYLRWPANWNQVTDNILHLKETLPSNVMFFIQETTSCLNLFYADEVSTWVKNNFSTNREGDPTEHATQLATHSYLNVGNITQEYVDALAGTNIVNAISSTWKENPVTIKTFLRETQKFDQLRGQDWKKTFPEVAHFYSRYF